MIVNINAKSDKIRQSRIEAVKRWWQDLNFGLATSDLCSLNSAHLLRPSRRRLYLLHSP